MNAFYEHHKDSIQFGHRCLTAGLLAPFRGDGILVEEKHCQLDRLHQRVCDDLDALLRAVDLRIAA